MQRVSMKARRGRGACVLLAALLIPATASAQEAPTALPGTSGTSRPGTFQAPGDVDAYTVPLAAGRDYALGVDARGDGAFSAVLRGPDGAELGSTTGIDEVETGFEFRAARDGVHTVELRRTGGAAPLDYAFRVVSDCRGDADTRCVLRRGRQQRRNLAHAGDVDRLRLATARGRRHELVVEGVGAAVEVLGGDGAVLGAASDHEGRRVVAFVAGRGATYHARVAAADDAGGAYTIRLDVR